MKRTTTATLVGLAATALVAGGTLAPTAVAGPSTGDSKPAFGSAQQLVVDGLSNPRQIALGKRNAIVIAESGEGDPESGGGFGTAATSQISVVTKPTAKKPGFFVEQAGMLSGANFGGAFSTGTHGVDVAPDGTIYAVNTAGQGNLTGKLFTVKNGRTKVVADLTAYEFANDPDGQGTESNPYAVLAQKNRVLVVDAAGNDVLSVDRKGRISVWAVLPNINTGACKDLPNHGGTVGCDFVPTAIAEGPKGSVYVAGEVAGLPGEGVVWKFNSKGRVQQKWSGFNLPLGVAVDKAGTFYVSEMTGNGGTGAVVRVRGSKRVSIPVAQPAGLAIVGNKLFVAANSISPSGGMGGNAATSGRILRMNR